MGNNVCCNVNSQEHNNESSDAPIMKNNNHAEEDQKEIVEEIKEIEIKEEKKSEVEVQPVVHDDIDDLFNSLEKSQQSLINSMEAPMNGEPEENNNANQENLFFEEEDNTSDFFKESDVVENSEAEEPVQNDRESLNVEQDPKKVSSKRSSVINAEGNKEGDQNPADPASSVKKEENKTIKLEGSIAGGEPNSQSKQKAKQEQRRLFSGDKAYKRQWWN